LYIAVQQGFQDIAELLMNDPRLVCHQAANDASTPLYIACQKGFYDLVQLLIERAPEMINQAEKDNCSPLWIASQNGHLKVVELLLASEVVVDTLARTIPGINIWNGRTAVEKAREKNFADIVEVVERYQQHAGRVRRQLRLKHGLAG